MDFKGSREDGLVGCSVALGWYGGGVFTFALAYKIDISP